MRLPPMDVGYTIIGRSKDRPTKTNPNDAMVALNQYKKDQTANSESQSNQTEDGRFKNFGSLFNRDSREFMKELHKGSGKKFTEIEYDRRLHTSFSGTDTKLSISFKGGEPIYIGETQTVTYSLFRPVEPVYVLGDSRPNGFVRGQRTIAGSVIFTVFDRNVLLNAFYNAYNKYSDSECIDKEYLTDELPPFDMHLTFMNEYGVSAALVIYGCYIPSEGQVHSVEDMITENTIQYVARDITLMRPGDIT